MITAYILNKRDKTETGEIELKISVRNIDQLMAIVIINQLIKV